MLVLRLAVTLGAVALLVSSHAPAAAARVAGSGAIIHLFSLDAVTVTQPKNCQPKKDIFCVMPGGKTTHGLQFNCHGSIKRCRTVSWSVTTTTSAVTASFNPSPGDPTMETLKASPSAQKGKYSQTITVRCTDATVCPYMTTLAFYLI